MNSTFSSKLVLSCLALVLALLLFVRATPALAATCDVPSSAHHTIKLALNDSACSLITLAAGTYLEHNLTIARSVRLRGAGSQTTVIDGQNAAPVFILGNGSFNVTLTGLTIQHGNAVGTTQHGGGGLDWYTDGNGSVIKVTIKSSRFLANHAQYGGAIYVNQIDQGIADSPISLTLNLNHVVFDSNTADASGGAIWTEADANIVHSSFENNNGAAYGGALLVSGHALGGINDTISRVAITQTAMFKNTADRGGAISASGNILASLFINSSTLQHNTANIDGGGLLAGSPTSITNSTFSGNQAVSGVGGGIYGDLPEPGPYVTLLNDTFQANSAGTDGGSLAADTSTVSHIFSISNTILNRGKPDNCEAPAGILLTSHGSNLSSDNSCTSALNAAFDQNNHDAMLAKLAPNGSFPNTHALKAGSPAIDAVLNNCPPPATDERGVARPINGTHILVARCDIGAYEYQPPAN